MKQTILKYLMIGVLIISSISCMDKERDLSWERRHMPKEAYFDFNMTQAVALDINYCFKSENYRVLFDIYDQDPIEYSADGSVSQKDIEPIYRAVTDEEGKFSGEMNIPADLSEVWLSSDYLATVSPLKLTIDDSRRLSFNQDAYIATLRSQTASKTRGVTVNQHTYLKEWHVLPDADWDDSGRPTNLEPKINIPPADVLYNIKYVFRKVTVKDESGKSKVMNISQNYPEFFDGSIKMTSDIPIVSPTEVGLVFVTSSAAWYNTVGYYTYPTNNPPQSANDIKQIIAFPNTSPIYKTLGSGALVCGEEIKLKYWNEDTQEYEDKFPAGVTIGWCLQGMGFKSKLTSETDKDKVGDIIKGMGARYSTRNLNTNNTQRTVSLRDSKSGQIVAVGFEDNVDFDYADAIFYIHTSEKNAIDPALPALPEDPEAIPEQYKISYSGTLAFEDLWPKLGDYDMNDVMVKYTSTMTRNALDNRIYEIEDKFILQHCGGYLQNGFGYQLHKLSNSNVKSVKITGPDASGLSSSIYMEGKETEPGQSHPTILLYDDMTKFKNITDESKKEYTVTITLDGASEKEVVPPYNPFIFISSNEGRGKELHLINYPPTDKADLSLLGTGKDIYRPEEGMYYVSADLMPFAINMPVSNLPVPEEGKRIDQSYPKFSGWVSSNGKQNKDWYK